MKSFGINIVLLTFLFFPGILFSQDSIAIKNIERIIQYNKKNQVTDQVIASEIYKQKPEDIFVAFYIEDSISGELTEARVTMNGIFKNCCFYYNRGELIKAQLFNGYGSIDRTYYFSSDQVLNSYRDDEDLTFQIYSRELGKNFVEFWYREKGIKVK